MNHSQCRDCYSRFRTGGWIEIVLFMPALCLIMPFWLLGFFAGVAGKAAQRGFSMGVWMIHRATDCDHGTHKENS